MKTRTTREYQILPWCSNPARVFQFYYNLQGRVYFGVSLNQIAKVKRPTNKKLLYDVRNNMTSSSHYSHLTKEQ